MTEPHKIRLGVRISDYVAMQKLESGQWTVDTENGIVYSSKTNKPLKFTVTKSGYLNTSVHHKGEHVTISKHRIVYLAGHYLAEKKLPCDLNMEIDHINHDPADCRMVNLREITAEQNRIQSSRKFNAEQIISIRKRVADGETRREIACEFGVTRDTIEQIVKRTRYKEIP